jgi:hypothetical protein
MRTALRSLTAAALTFGFALSLPAIEEGTKNEAKPAAEPAAMYKLPGTVTLTDEQKAKLDEIKKEYTPKFRELAKKSDAVLTKEQKKARRDAQKAGKEAGKKQKEIQADVSAAMNLTDDQKKQRAEIKEQTDALKAEMESKVVALLTDDQKAQVEAAKKKANKKAKKAA